ncbi:hyaluronate lyase N-terminal domain-containing protein [Sphingobium yanoikuyae]|uniref:hyaluronate lyase N-terminal domain-containing protein n=1 Tax=Sphingobium yanoikuyae TaxID=13690 RepID=UPI0028ADB412|nr:PE-PGRS family protein [Sphingobium yanoikuyae]
MATVRFQLRRDTSTNWASVNPTLGPGEPALETDTLLVKYGDGSTDWSDLPYAALNLPSILAAYAAGDVPSAFTLSIVDSSSETEWRNAIGAQEASANLDAIAAATPIGDGPHTVGGITITTVGGIITAIS